MRQFVALSCLLLSAAPFFPARTATNADVPPAATKFLDVFDRLRAAYKQQEAGDARPQVNFQFSEMEFNEYLRYSLKTTPRPGIDSVVVKFLAKDSVSTLTRIDWDAVERWRPGTIPSVLKPLLKGKKSVSIDFHFQVADSKLTYTVDKARYEDMNLSPFLVEKMIQIVGARQPEKFDASKPLPLPFDVSKVWTTEHNIHGKF